MAPESFSYSDQPRKRNRLTLSCNYCKKRKVKCDRGKPCSSCVKYNVGDRCVYPDPAWPESEEKEGTETLGFKPTFSVTRIHGAQHNAAKGRGLSNGRGKKARPDSVPEASGVMSELELLKSKISQIEASMKAGKDKTRNPRPAQDSHEASQFQRTKPLIQEPTGPFSRQGSYSFSPSFQRITGNPPPTTHNPVQLPPINWSPLPVETAEKAAPVYTRERDDYAFDPTNKIQYLAANPYDDPEEPINFYDGYDPVIIKETKRKMNFGIFSWLTLARKDPAMTSVWSYLETGAFRESFAKKLWGQQPEGPNAEHKGQAVSDLENDFKARALTREGDLDCTKYQEIKQMVFVPENHPKMGIKIVDNTSATKSDLNRDALPLGLTMFEGSIEGDLKLAEKIVTVLPPRKVIWTLINKFFVYVYPFLPFLDETSIKLEFTRLIGPEDYVDEKIKEIKVEKRLDFAYCGIMLLMLRFAYLSLFSNEKEVNEFNLSNSDPSPKAQELRFLLSNPINIDVVDMAQLCINSFDLLRKSNFTVLQLAFMFRVYHMFGPEEGDSTDGGAAQISNGMLVQIAICIGVNREPTKFAEQADEKTNNVSRKLWFFLVINDLVQGYQFGNPPVIDENSFDTSLPFYKKGNENIQDTEMEKYVNSTFAYFDKYYSKLKVLLKKTLNLRAGTPIQSLVESISDFEHFIFRTFGTMDEFMIPFSEGNFKFTFMKTMKCKNYINLTSFIQSITMHLFLHWEANQNYHLAFFYLRKICAKAFTDLVPYYSDLWGRNHVNFGESADLILNPSVLSAMHKTGHFAIAILVRVNTVIFQAKEDPQHDFKMTTTDYRQRFYSYCRLSKHLEKIMKYCITSISKFSNRYYYAWRITKVQNFIYKVIISEDFYRVSPFKNKNNILAHLTTDQVEDMNRLMAHSLALVASRKRENEGGGITSETPNLTGFASQSLQEMDQPIPSPAMPTTTTEFTPFTDSSDSDYNQYVNNRDIDRLWFQMISHKQDEPDNSNDFFQLDPATSFSPPQDFDMSIFLPPNTFESK